MGVAWLVALLSFIGRFDLSWHVHAPPDLWVMGLGGACALVTGVGSWFGGELVYTHGIGTDSAAADRDAPINQKRE